jgi:hypothetical protein
LTAFLPFFNRVFTVASFFDDLPGMIADVRYLHEKFTLPTPPEGALLARNTQSVAHTVIQWARDHPDDWVAGLYLHATPSLYRPTQQLLGAALVAILGLNTPSQRPAALLSSVCAALTRDLGLAVIDKTATGSLNDALRRQVQAHPDQSVALLKRAGIHDGVWLSDVAAHHERPDGLGYPLRTPQAPPSALRLAFADALSSLILPKPHLAGGLCTPSEALKKLRFEVPHRYRQEDVERLEALWKTYPPGTLLRMNDGHVVLILRAQDTLEAGYRLLKGKKPVHPPEYRILAPTQVDTERVYPAQVQAALQGFSLILGYPVPPALPAEAPPPVAPMPTFLDL